jgi:chondroitin 4-sulfotransferase 11
MPRWVLACPALCLVLCVVWLLRPPPPALLLGRQGAPAEYTGRTTGDEVQAARRAAIRTECQAHAGHGAIAPMNPFYPSRFYPGSLTVAEEEGLAWCRVGSAGFTAWSAFFLLLRGTLLTEVRAAIANHTVHSLLKRTFPSRPGVRDHMVRGEHGKAFFTFLVVRHPFDRLLSAYRDKLERLTEYNLRYHMKDAPRMTDRRYNSSVAASPTFAEFVDYLVRTPPNLMDSHWAPYSKLCLPCNVSYSAVLKAETVQHDADWLFPRLGLAALRAPWEAVVGRGGSRALTAAYFHQLGREEIGRLYTKYQVDFRLFGYDGQVRTYIDMGS